MHSKQPIAPQQGQALSRTATELFIVSLSNLFTGAPPTIAQRPQNVTMVAGPDNHATLTCGVDGKPDPVISWLFSKSMVIQRCVILEFPGLLLLRYVLCVSGS